MSARAAPRLTAVVDLPTPPFWFAIAMIRATPGVSGTWGCGLRFARLALAGADAPPFGEEGDELERETALAPDEAVVTAGS